MTNAEQALERFRSQTKTISITEIGRSMRATMERDGNRRIYTFGDGSKLCSKGRGKGHSIEIVS